MSVFYDLASLVLVPSGYKASKVYAQKPLTTDGQLAFSRASTATRRTASGTVETVASNVPRLNYKFGETCPKLLLEPQRSNVLLQSNSFNTTWVPSNVSVTGGQAGYDGTNDAWLIDITGGTSSQRINQTISASGVLTFSVYAKAGTLNWISLRGDAPAVSEAYFNLATGALGSLVGAAIDSSIESVGSGWYRCSVSFVNTTIVRIYLASGNVNVNQSSGNVYIQDAQLEAGAYPTSVINTTTAAVTRLADAAFKTGISSLIGQTEGTLFCEVDFSGGLKSQPIRHIFNISDGTDNNRINIFIGNNTTEISFFLQSPGGVFSAGLSLPNITKAKIAAAYKSGSSALYVNGALAASFSDTFAFAATLGRVVLGSRQNFTNELGDGINQALLFKTRLTNAQLAELTAL